MNLSLSLNLIIFLLFIQIFNPSSSQDVKYNTCSQKIPLCGHLSEISYPFYDDETRPSYCGHPGFKLDCHHNLPKISISTLDYFLLSINKAIVTVARADTWSFPNCPSNLVNTTIDPSLFEFTSSDQNITFFYDCEDHVSMFFLNCHIDEQLIMGYYMTSKMQEESDFHLWEICKGSLSFPILNSLESTIDIGIKEPFPFIMNRVFQRGFELGMVAELGKCSECVESGGQCGFDSSSNKFVCYCTDDDNYGTKCGVNSYRAMELYLLILVLSFTSLLRPSSSSPNTNYDTCTKTFQCGTIQNIGYPFYDGSTRPEFCGYPGFKLDCDTTLQYPQITISSQAYNLLSVSDDYRINISRTDTWGGNCPTSLVNTTMDFSIFKFSTSDENITFFYNCEPTSSQITLLSQSLSPTSTHCSNDGSQFADYYLTQAMIDQYKNLNMFEICSSNLVLPALKSQVDAVSANPSPGALLNAFSSGFELGLIAETDTCGSCKLSGGECGYNSDSNKFACHCSDKDYDLRCGDDSPQSQAKSKKGPIIGVVVGVVALVFILLGAWFLFIRRRKKKQLVAQDKSRGIFPIPSSFNDGGGPHASTPGSNGLTSSHAYTSTPSTCSHSNASYMSSGSEIGKSYKYGVHVFNYTELEIATNNFDESKELGDGGFGTVYYGVLRDGRCVAVKRLYENSAKRKEQFENEIKLLANLEHKNLVRLYGCTSSKSRELLLVYEFIANGTVADHLHGKFSESTFLRWPARLNIAVETAEALAFLHRNTVIHRDVKTTNILLDDGFHVKVADFGLSREFRKDMTHVSTAPQGTPGYVDPEYYQCYRLTEKSDVYSFGVVLIELISSKHAVDITRHRHDVNLASMAVDRIQNQALHELVDPRLEFDKDQSVQAMVKMVAELGFQCLQPDREMRPTMDEVVARLRAVQLEGVKEQKQEVLDIIVYGDDAGLLTNPTPPLSPELPRSNDDVV